MCAGGSQQTSHPVAVPHRPSTALAGPTSRFSISVTSSVSNVPSRENRLRRSLRDDRRGSSRGVQVAAALDCDVIRPPLCPSSAWTAAALKDHRRSADIDAVAMAARERAVAVDGVGVAEKESGGSGTAGGGLSLSSTASNDTGYCSVGNSGERLGPGRVMKSGSSDVDVTSVCRSTSSSCCHDDMGDSAEQRPSVAELRQRFQTHGMSQPAELSKRCMASFSPTSSAGIDLQLTVKHCCTRLLSCVVSRFQCLSDVCPTYN